MSDNLPKTPGFASYEVVRNVDDGSLTITTIAQTGEPIDVIKLVVVSGGNYAANPSATASPIPAGKTIDITADALTNLKSVGIPATIQLGTSMPSDAFVMTIIGQTSDGQESVLQTVNVPAAW